MVIHWDTSQKQCKTYYVHWNEENDTKLVKSYASQQNKCTFLVNERWGQARKSNVS